MKQHLRPSLEWTPFRAGRGKRQRLVVGLGLLGLACSRVAQAQSIDDLELRKRQAQTKIRFGLLGVLETAASLNADRPTLTNFLFVAPQLKIGDRWRLRLNMGAYRHWLARQANPWDFSDLSLQLTDLKLYRERLSGILLSGYLRYSLPTSKASRNADSYGQLRAQLKLSRALGSRLFLAVELGGHKNFHRLTAWSPSSGQSADSWTHAGFYDAYVENNVSFGFDESLTFGVSLLRALDFNLVAGLYQQRQYDGADAGARGARQTTWLHYQRFVVDLTANLGGLLRPAGNARSDRQSTSGPSSSLLSMSYLSLGYALFAPQLRDGLDRSLNPFDPRYAAAYLDLMVIY